MTHSKETKSKIRKARRGTHQSVETKAKIQAAMLERAEWVRQGLLPRFQHSEATKAKMRKSAKHRKPSQKAMEVHRNNAKDFQAYLEILEYQNPGYIRKLRKDPVEFKKFKTAYKNLVSPKTH